MTLHNWKTILENWINCYFERPSNSKQKVEVQSLLNIISYLRDNLCLDDSKSSLIEAQTLEEFIQEKFPDVSFQKGVEISTENELYIVASLILFFICVNSKDIDIKNAMCNKLGVNDQETIMKFTKVLMESAVITCKDVQNAIAEACNVPAASVERSTTVAETPPAIRNMHGEVRRLQAALEAERFDKNFLQEELTRTNHKLEKLMQDKMQYKVDILALKAKISNCCGQDSDRQSSNEAEHNASAKLLRQLEEMEERLVDTRSQLDEAVHERNIYKAKVEELKVERNKWINSSQEESSRVTALTQQLEVEHHNNELLKELVADLRQHNAHNKLDTSQLECDDPDVSLQSIGRNMSVCNEVCANVVEVQLSEERDKIVVLQQQINLLQEQLNQVEQTYTDQKYALERMLLSKNQKIECLKLEVNEGKEQYNSLKISLSDEIDLLKNYVDELKLKMKADTEEACEKLNNKEQDKLSLLQNFTETSDKLQKHIESLETENKRLLSELEEVINSKSQLTKESNKLVEQLEQLGQTANERKSSLEHMLLSKNQEIENLKLEVNEGKELYNSLKISSNDEIDQLKNYVDELKLKMKADTEEACEKLNNKEQDKLSLLQNFTETSDKLQKHIESLETENKRLLSELEEVINSKSQLTKESNKLVEQLEQLGQTANERKSSLEHMLLSKNQEIEHLKLEVNEGKVLYNSLKISLSDEIDRLKNYVDELKLKMKADTEEACEKLNNKEQDKLSLLQNFTETSDKLQKHIESLETENKRLLSELEEVINSKSQLTKESNKLVEQLEQLGQTANERKSSLEHMLLSKNQEIENLKLEVNEGKELYNSLEISSNDEIDQLKNYVDELKLKMKADTEEACEKLNNKEQDKLSLLQNFTETSDKLQKHIESLETENKRLLSELEEVINSKSQLTKESNKLVEQLEQLGQTANERKSSLEHMLLSKNQEIEHLKLEVNEGKVLYNSLKISLSDEIDRLKNYVDELKLKMKADTEEACEKLNNKEQDKLSLLQNFTETSDKLQKHIESLETENKRLLSELEEVINSKSQLTKESNKLVEQLEQLGQTANERKSSLEHMLLSKNQEIEHLKLEVNEGKVLYNSLKISLSDEIDRLKNYVDELKLKKKADTEEACEKLNNKEQDKLSLLQNFTETSDKLQKHIESLETENKRLLSELEEVINSKSQLTKESNKLVEQLEQLGQTANERKSSLEHMLLSKNQEIENLKLEVNEGKELYNSLKISLSDEIDRLKNYVDELKLKMKADTEEACEKLNNKEQDKLLLLQNFTETSDKLQKHIESLETENKRLLSELEEVINSKSQLTKESNKLVEQLEQLGQTANERKSSLEHMLLSKNQEIEHLKLEVNEGKVLYNSLKISLSDEIDRLKNYVDELKLKKKADTEEACEKLNNKEQDKLSLLQNFTETSDKLQKHIESLETENKRLLSELEEVINSKSQLTKESNKLVEQLEQLGQTANERKSSLEHMLLSKNQEIENLKLEVNEGKELYNSLKISLSDEIDRLKNYVDELKLKMKADTEEACEKLNNKEQDKLLLLQNFTETSDKLQKHIESLETENKRLLSELEEVINSKSQLTKESNKLVEQLEQLGQTANERKSSLEHMLLSKNQEIENLKLEVNEGKELYNSLKISSNDEIDQLKNYVDELKLKMKADMEEACEKLNNKEQDKLLLQRFTESTNGLQKKIESMEIENETLIHKLKEEISCKLTLMEETNVLHETLKHIQLNFVGEKTTMSQLISKQDIDVKAIIIKIKEAFEDYKQLKTLSEQEVSRLNNYINEVENKKRDCDEIILRKEQEIKKLEEDLHSKVALKNEVDILQDKLNQIEQSATEDKMSLLELISRKDEEIESLKQTITEEVQKQISLEKSLTNDVTILNNKINELGQTIKETQELSNQDKEEKMLLLNKINVLKKEVKEMETENKELRTELNKNKNSHTTIQENYEVTFKEWNDKIQLLNVKLNKWLHSSEGNILADCKEKVNEQCCNLVLLEPVEMTQQDDDKAACCGDSTSDAVVEVQMNRQSDHFKQHIDSLENKLKQYQQIAKRDKAKLEEVLSSKDAEIAKLKCQVRAEIEKYISLKESLNDEIRRLHSDISHYEVKLNECEKLAYNELNQKVKDISTLQEDKLTLLKSLTDRIDRLEEKLETVECENHTLKNDLNKEQDSKLKMQDDYENHITKLNEKITKMSLTENRASQIIKVSAKYQAIILKRVAEIKSNTVLKELTNFSNMPCDNEVRRSLNAGSITMEELESFLETTDKHLRKCSEKQNVLQKERDRLAAVVKINESEIINMKKYLTELSVYFRTFGSVKQVYNQKLSQLVSQQRTVRREMLSLEERLSDGAIANLERGYTSVLQDLTECAMSFERWVERCISRTVSPEKISLTFTSEHASLLGGNFHNSGLDSQLDQIEKGFQRLLQDMSRAQRGDGAKDAQTMTIMEVKAEYEDKLERMKAKMKQIYQEQTTIFREKQREEVASLERQLQHARDKLVESSRAYEEHIRGLTSELWNVGEKFLIEKNEADWLKRKCISGSLMSLQQVHSSGLVPPREVKPRPSDTYSLRSLPLHNKSEARTLHMSDEEGEVFDNRWLKELSATPRSRRSPQMGGEPRLSELRYRNSLCPPHLKSSYPAETQFASTIDEEDIKCSGIGGRQRKEVGITAYKKPGPPTPSKQAGRLSATDSDLREGLRSEPDTTAPRKTSTPSRIRALFRSSKTLTDNTASPRRRLSIFRNKK